MNWGLHFRSCAGRSIGLLSSDVSRRILLHPDFAPRPGIAGFPPRR